jgi:2OG-Fe(II) oxygenase superfamily
MAQIRKRQGLLVLPGFIAPEYCHKLIDVYEEGTASARIRARGTNVRDISLSLVVAHDHELSDWARDVRDAVGNLLADHFDLPGLFADYTAFKCEYKGGGHRLHADNATPSGDPNHTYWREATAMLYLNDGELDFEGGRIRFARLEREVVPKPGLLVGFGCGLDFEHEVTNILSGTRYSIALWFTRDSNWREGW